MIQLSGAAKGYGGNLLFDAVDWMIGPNDRVGLVGANGTGKSTLLRLLRACRDGEIAISDATRRLAGERFEWFEAGSVDGEAAPPIVFYGIGKRAVAVPASV